MAKNPARIAFIEKYKNDVVSATAGTGIFPSVKMAQMIIESSDSMGVPGNGLAVKKARNYFGIKANKSWLGPKVALNTPKDGQPVNYFRVYDTAKDSIKDHTAFLKDNGRYAAIFNAKSPAEQAILIEKAGYAEGAGYASKIAQIIRDYGLEALDKMGETLKKKE